MDSEHANLIQLFEPKKRSFQDKETLNSDDIWCLIQLASHPHAQSLYNIVKQLSLQHCAKAKFTIQRPVVPYLIAARQEEEKLNQISVTSLQSLFSLLQQVSLSSPSLLAKVISTTDKCVENLPHKCFAGNELTAGSWLEFLQDISRCSADKTTFKVLLCVAILQDRADSVLSAVRHTLKGRISDIQCCSVMSQLQQRSLDRYKQDCGVCADNWYNAALSNPVIQFDTGFIPDPDTFTIASDGLHVYVYNKSYVYKYSTGLAGSVKGKCVKKSRIAATKLHFISTYSSLLAIKTAKAISLVAINKDTLTIDKTFRISISADCKYFTDGLRVLVGSGSWSALSVSELDMSLMPLPILPTVPPCALPPCAVPTSQVLSSPAVLKPPHSVMSVTNPVIIAFGASICDSEKLSHPIVSEDVNTITGTESFTLHLNLEGKLMFRGNADEIGTGQGLIDKWIEISIGGINRFSCISCPHQEKYVLMISEHGKPYIAGNFKKGVDGDSSKPKKKPATTKPKAIDRIKDKVVACAAGNTTSAFVTECGQLYMFGSLAAPFDSSGLVPQFSVLSVKSVALGHSHAAIVTSIGQVYTMGSNTLAQCGRNYIANPDINPEDDESDSDDGMCDSGTHVWRNILCMICFFCGECTGYGQGCCRNGEPGRDPGLECGCGAGDSGCSICGCCKSCAKEAQLVSKKNAKFKAKNEPKPLRFESDESSGSEHSSDEDEDEDEEEEENQASKADRNNGAPEADTKVVSPAELTRLPAPVKLPCSAMSVKQLACGMHHTVVVLESGEVLGFGSNTAGQLGLGPVPVVSAPTLIQNLDSPAVMVACGATHTVVLANNQVFSCGKYMDGQLGRCPSDFSKELIRSDSSLNSKSWFSYMCRVPGFGPSSSRDVVSVSAVGNRTFVKCRTPLVNRDLLLDDEVEVIVDDGKFILCVPDASEKLALITSDKFNHWKSQDSGLGSSQLLVFDHVYRTMWTGSRTTGAIAGYTSFGSSDNKAKVSPLSMLESLLPHCPAQDVDKEALCYALLSHVTLLANPALSGAGRVVLAGKEEAYSYCNRFPSFGGGWGYSGKSVDAILFSTEQDVLLHGVGLYGGRGNYSAKLKLFDIGYGGPEPDDGDLIFEIPSFNYSCKPKATHQLMFDEPIHIVSGTWYRIILKVEGPSSDCGNSGKREVSVDGVKFTFRSSKRSTNGTDYGSGQIPQFVFKKNTPTEEKAPVTEHTTDVMSLGNWEQGLAHLMAIIKLSFTTLHTYIKTRRSGTDKIHKSTMSLNLTQSDVSMSSSSISSMSSTSSQMFEKCISMDPKLQCLESKICVPISTLDIYLAVAPNQPASVEKERLLRECQDILSAILKLPAPACNLAVRVTKVYSKHFHLFYTTPQHYWAAFLSAQESYKKNQNQYCSILATILQAMCYQGDNITNELFHYGTLSGLILPRTSDMSLGSQDTGDEQCSTSDSNFELLNNFTYKRALGDVVSLAMSDTAVGQSARKLLKTILQQMVLASMDMFGPLSVAANKETSSRFTSVNIGSWNPKNKIDAISFTVNNPNIFLSGIGVFQAAKDTSCDVEVLVLDSQDKWKSIFNHSGQLKRSLAQGHVNRLIFKRPVALKADLQYTIKVQQYSASLVHGTSTAPISYITGPDGVTFTLSNCVLSTSGTNLTVGQIPFLVYKTQLNQEIKDCGGNERYENVTLQLMELITSAFVKLIDKTHLDVPVAWAEDGPAPAVEPEDKLPEFITTAMSYTQLILLNKNTPKSSYLLLDVVLKPLLLALAEYNHKDKRLKEQEQTEVVIVESAHPYPEATVLHYQALLSDTVTWMVAEFSPESGVGPDDSLQLFIPKDTSKESNEYINLEDKGGKNKPILKLGSAKDWPKRALLLPGNAISFILKSVTKANKQQLNDSDWGFSCKITGYKYLKKRRNLAQLEHMVADLAGICVRVMISPSNGAYQNLSQEGQYAFKSHAKLLGRGLYLNSLPSYSALQKKSFLAEEPKKMTFLKGFMEGCSSTSGGRLALWLNPAEEVDITKAHIEIGIFDGEECHFTGTTYPVVCCTQTQDGTIIFPLGAKVSISLSKVDTETDTTSVATETNHIQSAAEETDLLQSATETNHIQSTAETDLLQNATETEPSFEEARFNISKDLRLPTIIDAKSYNNGFYSITWQPTEPGIYEMTVLVDGVIVGTPVRSDVGERTKPMIKTKKSEELLEEYKKQRKTVSESKSTLPDKTLDYEVIKCGAAGHTVRGAMSTTAAPVGMIAAGHSLQITKSVRNSEGVWGVLTDKSIEQYCTVKCASAYTLISSPFNTFLVPSGASDPSQVFIFRTTSRQDHLPQTVVFDHASSTPPCSSDNHSAGPAKSDYSLSFISETSLVDDIDVKCVNSRSLTTTIRTVFAAYLWHYGAVEDAMAAAAYIKFENTAPNRDSDHQDLKRHKSTPSTCCQGDKSTPSKIDCDKPDFEASPSLKKGNSSKKRTASYTSHLLPDQEEDGSSPAGHHDNREGSALSMLCSLWDSVKELIMTCATTKIKPPPPITDNKDNTKPKKKRSKKGIKVQYNNEGDKEQCELCGEKVEHPVTYHMAKYHPGCKSNCGGMGYNGKGIYCSGWSGLCGDGGKGLCTWYLLCSECVETYKQEPLPVNDPSREIVYPIDPTPNLPTVSTTDLEEQLKNTYQNALFLLSLAPIVEVSRPDNLDYETFMEEAMETDLECTRNKFRSLQLSDSVAACLSPMTPMSPGITRFPGNGATNKMVRSLSVNILPSNKDKTATSTCCHGDVTGCHGDNTATSKGTSDCRNARPGSAHGAKSRPNSSGSRYGSRSPLGDRTSNMSLSTRDAHAWACSNTSLASIHVPHRQRKMVKSFSIAGIPRSVGKLSEPKASNILHNPSPQLKRLATVISLDRGWLFGFMSQKQPLHDLQEELIRGVEKAWSVSKGLLAADWLLRTVSSLPILHCVLWRLYMGLLSDPASATAREKEGLLPICQHPISNSIKCYDSCVSAAFRTVMQSLSDLLPRLPPGSEIQKVAISCWNLEFRPEDHKFLQDSQVFSHIHRLLTSASRRDAPPLLPNFNKSVEIKDVELTASSRDALIPYLTDRKTDTFWESGDKDNWVGIKLAPAQKLHALAIHLNNEEDKGFLTTKVSIKVGNVPKVLKTFSYMDLSARHNGWLWFEVSGYSNVEIEFTAKNDHVRVRQVIVYGGMEQVECTSTIPSSQQYSLQVFRVLTNDILKNITKEDSSVVKTTRDEAEGAHTSADLQEHLVSILFEQAFLTETQNKVLLHVVNAIRKQALAITDKNSFNDDYCFELLSLVSALSGSAAGCYNLAVHESLIRDVFKLLHLGTKRIQRQVILLLRRILTQISPERLCSVTGTHIPRFPYDEDKPTKPAPQPLQKLQKTGTVRFPEVPQTNEQADEQPAEKHTENRTVLNNLLAYVMKSIKLIVKSKARRSGDEYTKMQIKHTDYWVHGTVAPALAQEVMTLLKDMIQGNIGEEWRECAQSCLSYIVFSLTNIPEECRTEENIAQNRTLWLALAALSVMDQTLMSCVTVSKDGGKVEYCENHDDDRTKAIIACNKCGFLCAECDKYLHLNRKSKAHQRQVFKAAEASLVLNKHENMSRAKLYWLMAVVDTHSSKAVIEFRNTSHLAHASQSECRFCNEAGDPNPEGGCVCKNEECNAKFKVSCKRTLPCGHPCNGNLDEKQCLPCLKNCSGTNRQDADDMCVICFTESLGCAPCVELQCGHILHTSCITTVVKNGWIGPRITFPFLHCPICKGLLAHEHLAALLAPLLELKEDVQKKSVMRLKYDGLSFDTESEAVDYAMNKYAYYQCFKCSKAYFGGEAQCQADVGDEFNPEDLVCGGCSNLSQEVCPKHGTDYLEYKCRYCCSVAVYFCFGSTHFCTPCHDDFVRLRALKRETLPSCPVGPKAVQLEGTCPLGLLEHPPTGEEFALGCGVCRNVQTF